ncbi:glutamate receptor 2.2 [Rosa chinensis]|uniref:glutamate receptor 2.2 n=1 Tax=Rosa chinensis TaxID=74649 RepID=UPI000D093FF4|nr:glutamate receptor 2.2 [Rosa chinensis]
MAVENVATRSTFGFRKTNDSINSSADLETLRVSRKGLEISKFLSSTRFRGGIAGDFSFVNGQLQSPMFEIVNVNGNGVRGIGFWTPQRGLVKSSNGWEVPTNGKKLRVGVPVKIGSPELVKVVRNPVTNGTEVTEFCIDIIKAVMEGLPYAVTYDFIPFAKPDGTTAGSYNDLRYFDSYEKNSMLWPQRQRTGSKTQSYGASLSSILTVPRLKPTYFEINELVKIRDYVGYPKGYFLCDLLIQSGFDDSKIEPYISREECDQLLTKGSANGGIAAAIDETPNLKLVLA